MKKLFLIAFFALLLTGAYAWAGFPGCNRIVHAKGHTACKTLPAISFESLHASRAVQVRLVDKGDSIRIEADHNLIDYVTVRKKGNTLHISLAPDIQPRHSHIRVTVPTDGRLTLLKATASASVVSETDLTGECVRLEASSSAELVAAVTADRCELAASSSADLQAGVRARECSIDASSSAELEAAVIAETCDVTVSSSAEVTLRGEARSCRTTCTSSADFEAGQFMVGTYDITACSSAEADIQCTDLLQAEASSAGTIAYRGSCRAETHTSSGGRIGKK